MKKLLLVIFLFQFKAFIFYLHSQTPVQVIRGKITDASSKSGLPGANVVIQNSDPLLGTSTNADGEFRIENVPVGRQSVKVTYMGYQPAILPEILISSGKESVINIELMEMIITAKEVEIKASVEKDKPINKMAMVSARSFNVEESRRYAGSADDPMRAVSSFAGVAGSADVNSNQIIIRGNSPKGLLWRVNGVDIPNPNHYAYVGTSGGGITMFSSQVLANSDFYTSAFPAEYGNALSGVFDMKFRNGNNEQREYAFQLGIQGLDLSAEGPFTKGKPSSYLFNYRYSILSFLQYIDPSMKNKVPQYQDLSFKLNFPSKKAGTFTLTGIGGISRSTYTPEYDSTKWKTLEDRTKSTLNNNMGELSFSHLIKASMKRYIESYLSASYNDIYFDNNYVDSAYQLVPQENIKHKNYRFCAGSLINHKFSSHHTNRTGAVYSVMFYNLDIKAINSFTGVFSQYNKGKGNTEMLKLFSESRISLNDNFVLTAGLNFQYFFLNNHYSVEPRIASRWQISKKHTLSLGYGMHSMAEDIGVYLMEEELPGQRSIQPNRNLNFSRAHHFVLGYDFVMSNDLRLKLETYYQSLYDIPVIPESYYSMINSEGWYSNDTMVNNGTGRNLGIDLTFEKFLTKQYYYLITVSLFESKYKGGDGITRNTRFNSNWVVNVLGGKEWTVRKKNIFGANLKINFTGGEYYVPIDLARSIEQHREVLNEAAAYSRKLQDFWYIDLTLTYRTNHKKFSGIWAVQVKNLLNRKPETGYVYNDFNQTIEPVRSMGIIPFISYKIEF